jgi:hypothetical protein
MIAAADTMRPGRSRPQGALFSRLILLVLVVCGLAAAELADRDLVALAEGRHPRDAAIDRALDFLRTQARPSGALSEQHPTALTALAVMAHLAAGRTTEDAASGELLRRGIEHVLDGQDLDGYFGRKDGSRMYGHGIATLMVAEAFGLCRDEMLEARMRLALEKAVAVTVKAAQIAKSDQYAGGWHYEPNGKSSDLSLSGWQLMALHATDQVGLAVPPAVIQGAARYARNRVTEDGKVSYNNIGDDRPALRGLALLSAGVGGGLDTPEGKRHIASITARIVADPIQWQGAFLFYRFYYDAVGLNRAAPEQWATYGDQLEKLLIEHQSPDGSWPTAPGDNEGGFGPTYRTSMAVLALTVRRHVLPAYQR